MGIAARTYRAWKQGTISAKTVTDALVVDAVRDAAWMTVTLADGTTRSKMTQFFDALPMPAFVHDKRLTVLASSTLGAALSANYRPGVNLLRAIFLDPAERDLHRDWDRAVTEAVSGIRAAAATKLDDAELNAVVGELSIKSDLFRRLWSRHDVHRRTGGTSLLEHPDVGPMELRHEKLTVSGTDGQTLVAYHAEPGSASEQALQLLGSMAASRAASQVLGPT